MIKIWLPLTIIFCIIGAWPIGIGTLICGICITFYEKSKKEGKMQDEIDNLKKEIESLKNKS